MRTKDLLRSLPSVALGIALVVVVLLAFQSRSLREELARVRVQGHAPPVGLVVPEFRALTLVGDSVTVGRSTRGQVLLFFNTTCAFCLQTLPTWHTITVRAREASPALEVFGLTIDPVETVSAYLNENDVQFDVVLLPDATFLMLYRVEGVPISVVVGPTGRVLHSRAGVLTPAARDSILQAAFAATTGSARPVRALYR